MVYPARNVKRKNTVGAYGIASTLTTPSRRSHYCLTDPVGAIASEPSVGVHRAWADSPADLYAAADVGVLPSKWEGWGLPVVEAAAAGMPVIAGPYPVLDEIRAFGIRVFDPSETSTVREMLTDFGELRSIVDPNISAVKALSSTMLPATLTALIEQATALNS